MIEPTEMEDAEYFKAKGISKSLLAKMDCPDKAFIKFEPTPAMLDGTLAHCAILEPDDFDNRYIVDPKMPKRSAVDKESWQQWQDDNQGKMIIKPEQYENSMRMAEAIRNHAEASSLLTGGIAEQAYFWDDERTERACKCKADYVQGDGIVDLKTAVDASPFGFSSAIAKFKYHWQDAWYSRGIGADSFKFIVIEKKDPWVIEVYELGAQSKAIGLAEVDKALDKWLWHKDFEPFKGYTGHGGTTELELPAWAMK